MPDSGIDNNNGHRLDRIERALEHIVSTQADDHTKLTRFGDSLAQLIEAQGRTLSIVETLATLQRSTQDQLHQLAGRVDQIAAAQQHADERIAEVSDKLNALIGIVEGLIHPPPPPSN